MNYQCQKTLKNAIHCSGVGLHSGKHVSLTLHPAKPDSGIVFRRTDPDGQQARIPARWDWVTDTQLRTTIGDGNGIAISTIEHLMAALAGCEIDNILVESDSAEIPIMDGSAAPFQFLIECAGLQEQKAPRQAIRIEKEIILKEGESLVRFRPADQTIIHCEIDFAAEAIAHQEYRFCLRNGAFKTELSRARTFGQLSEVDHLRQMGLAQGGSFANAILVNGEHVLNAGGLRFSDEFARHKVLDALGDLYLAGHPFIGEFYGYRCGHGLNNRILRTLLADKEAWSLCPIPVEETHTQPPFPVTDPVTDTILANTQTPLTATA